MGGTGTGQCPGQDFEPSGKRIFTRPNLPHGRQCNAAATDFQLLIYLESFISRRSWEDLSEEHVDGRQHYLSPSGPSAPVPQIALPLELKQLRRQAACLLTRRPQRRDHIILIRRSEKPIWLALASHNYIYAGKANLV